MSNIIESLTIIDDSERLFEATLFRDGEFAINAEDGVRALDLRYDLDEIRRIITTLSHLVFVAENRDDN